MNIEDKQNFEENLVKDNEMTDIPNKVEENNDMKDIDLKKEIQTNNNPEINEQIQINPNLVQTNHLNNQPPEVSSQ